MSITTLRAGVDVHHRPLFKQRDYLYKFEPGYTSPIARGWAGDYVVTESGELRHADVSLYASVKYTLLIITSMNLWEISGTRPPEPTATTYWLGSTPRQSSYAINRFLAPSKVRKLLAPMLKAKGPAKLAAEYVLADLDAWPEGLTYDLEDGRSSRVGSFWGVL